MVAETQQINEEDLSVNQKRKLELAKAKKLAEMKAAVDAEDRMRVEKLRAKKEREAKETEERRLKTEAIFRGMGNPEGTKPG